MYFAPGSRDGRVTRVDVAISGLSQGLTFRTAGSAATAGIVGTLLLKIALNFCDGRARHVADELDRGPLVFENLDTPAASRRPYHEGTCQCRGSTATSNLPLTGPVWLIE